MQIKSSLQNLLYEPKDIAPLVTFRILFGALMLIGTLRFVWNGWIEKLYLEPTFFFKFYGFEWVQPFGEMGMYLVFTGIALGAAGIMLGLFYRFSAILFFCTFTYVELIDATNYLNHYYLVCLLAFLLIFLPANRRFSLDVWRKPNLKINRVPAWTIHIIILQLTIVYTCAGIAKLNSDWLLRAMPLAVWLPEHQDWPILGNLFRQSWTPYVFSWGGAFYDLTVAFFLMHPRTRLGAYFLVVIFHLLTLMLFNIGLFPFIMIFSTLIFFPAAFHHRLLGMIGYRSEESEPFFVFTKTSQRFLKPFLILFIGIQLLLPFRNLLYPGKLLWTEEGYRFSWRVMLVEKSGQATFYVEDPVTKRKAEVPNGHYLTRFQEKQMSVQPDFILQFAHFIEKEYAHFYKIENPIVRVDSHVALNGRTSQQLIDPSVNLASVQNTWKSKKWVLPFRENE